MPGVAWSDDTAHAPRETPTQSRAVISMPGGPDAPFSAHWAAPEAWRRRCRPASSFLEARRAPRGGPADWTQPILVLPGSIRALIVWRVIELVNVTSTRPCVPPPLLTTCDQPSAELSTTLQSESEPAVAFTVTHPAVPAWLVKIELPSASTPSPLKSHVKADTTGGGAVAPPPPPPPPPPLASAAPGSERARAAASAGTTRRRAGDMS